MAPKKKKGKKGGKKGKKKSADGDEEQKNENEELKVELPKYGWIKITVSIFCAIDCKFSDGLILTFLNETVTLVRGSNSVIQLVRCLYVDKSESDDGAKIDHLTSW